MATPVRYSLVEGYVYFIEALRAERMRTRPLPHQRSCRRSVLLRSPASGAGLNLPTN
jgi:hypothetical protein